MVRDSLLRARTHAQNAPIEFTSNKLLHELTKISHLRNWILIVLSKLANEFGGNHFEAAVRQRFYKNKWTSVSDNVNDYEQESVNRNQHIYFYIFVELVE